MPLPPSGAIDCDIHPALPGTSSLLPYLDDYWRDTMTMIMKGNARMELNSYPPNAPLTSRPDWRTPGRKAGSELGLLREQALDHFGLRYAICNCVYGIQAIYNPDLGAALCRAMNDWMAKEWLDPEPRLRASIVISLMDPDAAAEEIERRAADKRFVQVLVLAMGEMPLGRRAYWPIYRAAEKHKLPIGVHAGGMMRHAPTQSGYPSYLAEDYVHQAQAFATQTISFVAEGVFAKFPELRVVLIESGVSWLPGLMWRVSKDWRGVRTEVPWLKKIPADIIRDHFRLTIQPLDAPPDPALIGRLLDQIGSDEMLLFATDYPHWQFDGDEVVPTGLPASLLRKIMVDNPLATYPRLKETVQ
ncbi:MAG TPA: amidohydrolase family protein [Stellaceae bacterium]|nr:amidohydrolase family protein [Stellaceae bacterium]